MPSERDGSVAPVRVLVASQLINCLVDEGSDIREQTAGMVEGNTDQTIELLVTDCRTVYEPRVENGSLVLQRRESLVTTWMTGVDVVHVQCLLPLGQHLLISLLFRLRGAKIVLSPMAFLTEDFTRRSWFRRRPQSWTRAKAVARPVLRALWTRVADVFVCQSSYDMAQSRLPDSNCVIVPLPKPNTPLLSGAPPPIEFQGNLATAPIAFISRLDPWRKGLDRLCTWLAQYSASLPHPAVLLLVPRDAVAPPQIEELMLEGVIEWDPETRGSDLRRQLTRCRGAMLLSRFDVQPRSLREALWLGLPILSTRECCLEEVTAVLAAGAVVMGDSPNEVQAAFVALAAIVGNPEGARRLFDRQEIGRFLLSLFSKLARGQRLPRSYYRESGYADMAAPAAELATK